MVLLLEHELFLPFDEFFIPGFIFDGHLDKHNNVGNNDLKYDWGPPDTACIIKVCVAWEEHEVDQDEGTKDNISVLLELELGVEVKISNQDSSECKNN